MLVTMTYKTCQFSECDRGGEFKGLCRQHRAQYRRDGKLKPLAKRSRKYAETCSYDGCDRPHESKGYCASHALQVWRGEEPHDLDRRHRITSTVRDELGQKQCATCSEWQAPSSFYNGTGADGLNANCTSCVHDKNVSRKFGISLGQYKEILESQDNKCATCDRHVDEFARRFAVDHDHSCCPGQKSCGKCVRGLLCSPCNIALGQIRDSRETLTNMEKYLIKWDAPKPPRK